MMTTDKLSPLAPKLRFPEFRDINSWRGRRLNELLQETKHRNRTLELGRGDVLSVSGEHGCVNQIEFMGRSYAGASVKEYRVVERGDIVYTKSPLKRNPYGIIKENKGKRGIVSTLYAVYRPFPGCSATYLDHYFSRDYNLNAYLQPIVKKGAKNDMKVNNADVLKGKICVPELEEQRKIADCLDSLDDLIAAEGRKLEVLRQHKQGLMQQLFPQPDETVPRLRFPEFSNEPEWRQRPLREIASYANGKAYEKHIVEDGQFVVVNSRFISTNGQVRKYTDEAFCIAKTGDVLIVLSDLPSSKALARCFLVGRDDTYAVNQRVARLRPKSVVSNFLFYAVEKHPYLMAFSDGINQTHLSKGAIQDCPLLVPEDPDEQRAIADCISCLDTQITSQSQQIDALTRHKRGLLQQLFPSLTGDSPS
jgi:type I restriction enzyme S subunit